MKEYKLLSSTPKRRGRGLFWLGLLLLAAAAADQFYFKFLGSQTLIVWAVGGLLIFIAIFPRLLPSSPQSGLVQIEEDGIIIKYAGHELPIPYEDMQIITGGKVSQHHSLKALDGPERVAVQPYFNQTHVFIQLHHETEELRQAREHMPSYMFGTKQVGLLLLVEGDWIPVERAIDEARVAWMGQLKTTYQKAHRPAKSDAWYDDDDYDDDDEWEEV